MTTENFGAFGFAEPLSRALNQCGYSIPTPVQSQALPPQLQNRDMLALAETGSGKTAAFVLPILNQFVTQPIDPAPRQVLTLILAPTRELAIQIDAEVASLSRNMRVRHAVVLGGVGKGAQINALKHGLHVLVATPGRLLDLVNTRHADLSTVRTLVLDEADRMFDMGFIRDIRKIASLLKKDRRTAMFSATMPNEIRTLAHELLNDPYRVELSPKQVVVDRIDQKVMIIRAGDKQSRLHTLLGHEDCSRVIVFTRTKRGADRVTDRLNMAGLGAVAIHGNKAQNARQRALNDFSTGRVRVLVATDIAARGIDVSDVSHVINFDMPMEAETYVHRIGRTARKGTTGIAISLCDPSERDEIHAIERLMKQKIEILEDVGGDVVAMPERRRNTNPGGQRRDGNPRREGGRRPGGSRGQSGEQRGASSKSERGSGRGDAPASANARPASEPRNGPSAKQWRPEEQKPVRREQRAAPAVVSAQPAATNTAGAQAARPTSPSAKKQHRKGQFRTDTGPRQGNWNGEQPPKFLRKKPRDAAAGNGSGGQRSQRERSPAV